MKPTVWHHLRLCPHGHPDETIDDAAIAVDETGTIVWLGAMSALPHGYAHWQREDLHGAWVTPGLVDCHTHLVYGGTRADEFAAPRGRELRGNRAAGRRDRVDSARRARPTRRRCSCRLQHACSRCSPKRDRDRDQVGLRKPTSRANARCCGCTPARRTLSGQRLHDPRRARAAARICGPCGCVHRRSVRPDAAGAGRRRPSTRSTCSANASAFRSRRPSACSRPRRGAAAREAACGATVERGRHGAGRALSRTVRRSPRISRRSRHRGDEGSRHGCRAAARRVLLHPRDATAADRAAAQASVRRSRSRPITTPARRRSNRCC